jgi:hypothetical protein
MALLTEDFTLAELRDHIRKSLGGSVWRLEGMGSSDSDLIDQAISGALMEYSRRVPKPNYHMLTTNSRKKAYPMRGPDHSEPYAGYGVWRVDFIEPVPLVAPITFNLLGVTPISNFSGDDIAQFINWRKTFRRVISSEPMWTWFEDQKTLFIYNVVDFAKACAYTYEPRSFGDISLVHKDFIRRFSIAQTKEKLALIRRKFGDIPGPGGNTIKLDGDALMKEAAEEMKECRAELMLFQPRAIPLFD